MTNRLNNFLNGCRILPNNPNNLPSTDANVLRVSYPTGKYYISHENYDSFIAYYIDVLTHEEFNYQKYQLNFGERDCDTKPLLLDFDFNYTANIEFMIMLLVTLLISLIVLLLPTLILSIQFLIYLRKINQQEKMRRHLKMVFILFIRIHLVLIKGIIFMIKY